MIINYLKCTFLFTVLFWSVNGDVFSMNLSKLKMQGTQTFFYTEGSNNKTRKTKFELDISTKKKLNQTVYFYFRSKSYFETGSTSAWNVNQFAPETTLGLYSAKIIYKPIPILKIELGAINQDWLNSPLLLDHIPFLSIKELINLEFKNIHFQFFAQHSVATNFDLSNRLGSVENGTPLFFIYGTQFKLKTSLVNIKLLAAKFNFSNQSSSTANTSRYFGNSISGTTDTNSSFLYKMDGLIFASRVSFLIGQLFKPTVHFNYIYNSKAPIHRNTAYRIRLDLFVIEYEISFFGERYSNETDASIGFYNSSLYHHNNNKGLGLGLEKSIGKYKIELGYNQNNIIEPNINVSDLQIFYTNFIFKI